MEPSIIQKIRKQIAPILKRHGVSKAALFGSFARGDAKKNSDVDILVKLEGEKSLLDIAELKIDLEEKLKKEVDIVEYSTIRPVLKNRILKEQVPML